MNVELIDYLGNDVTIANAARVSFHKETETYNVGPFSTEAACAEAIKKDPQATGAYASVRNGWVYERVKDADAHLINYLAREWHFSPFTHAIVQFRIRMPLFLARQWYK